MKNKSNTDDRDTNAWMFTFSDLLTLLLTFFVLLISMSTLDNQKLRKTLGFFLSSAGVMETGQKGGVGKVYIVPPRMQIAGGRLEAKGSRSSEMRLGDSIGLKGSLSLYLLPLVSLIDEASEHEDKIKKKKQLWMDELIRFRGIAVDSEGEETVLRVSSHLLFDSASADIHIEGLELLLWMSDNLRDLPYSIEVGGHTDNLPISTRRFPSNWELSLARAVNVVRFLEEAGRISGSRLAAAGYGDSKPLFPNNTAEARAKNRRVEIVLKENE
jgi:chemotaxis protein MotB